MEKTGIPWSMPVVVEDIPDTGLRMQIDAPAEARADVAKLAAVRDLPRLSAVFELTRRGAGVHVAGQVKARVGQICGITLEPIENAVEESVDLLFAPLAAGGPEVEIEGIALKRGEEPPEPLLDGKVDLGAIATEFLILGVDPYPRKAGAKFSPPKADNDGANHFAALEELKKRLGGGQS